MGFQLTLLLKVNWAGDPGDTGPHTPCSGWALTLCLCTQHLPTGQASTAWGPPPPGGHQDCTGIFSPHPTGLPAPVFQCPLGSRGDPGKMQIPPAPSQAKDSPMKSELQTHFPGLPCRGPSHATAGPCGPCPTLIRPLTTCCPLLLPDRAKAPQAEAHLPMSPFEGPIWGLVHECLLND